MKTTRLQSFEVPGLTGVAMRWRVTQKLAKKFWAEPENKRAHRTSLVLLIEGAIGFLVLMLMMYDPFYAPLRLVVWHAKLTGIVNVFTLQFGLWLAVMSTYVVTAAVTVVAFILALRENFDQVRRLWQRINRARDEEIEL